MNGQQIVSLTEADLHNIVKNAIYRMFNRIPLANGIYEITDESKLKRYSKQIWRILQNSYNTLGGFKSYSDAEEMSNRISLAVIAVSDRKIVACAIYRDDLGGQKLNGCGTLNGTSEQKSLLRSIIKEDIENFQKYHWVEVSYPLEKWFKEMNGNPIPSSLAHKLLHKSKSKIIELGDGVHYKRAIGNTNEMVTKAIYGFKDETIYNRVVNNLENYCNFNIYDKFKGYVNSLPKINEDIEYIDNHPNKDVALAMEIIIQIGNVWEDGIRELTPSMKEYLIASLTILNRTDKNKQINALIKNGNYYLNHMEVLECHNYVDYIIIPAL